MYEYSGTYKAKSLPAYRILIHEIQILSILIMDSEMILESFAINARAIFFFLIEGLA